MSANKLRLGVNIDHVATIRNARGGRHPDPVKAALTAVEAGADGITAHLREDRRHIRDDDITRLKAQLTKPLNFEMAATREMVDIALKARPHAACIVPERRQEVTTEGGLDVVRPAQSAGADHRRTEGGGHSRVAVHRRRREADRDRGRSRRAGDRDPYRRLVRGGDRRPRHDGGDGIRADQGRARRARRRSGSKSMPATGSTSTPPRPSRRCPRSSS